MGDADTTNTKTPSSPPKEAPTAAAPTSSSASSSPEKESSKKLKLNGGDNNGSSNNNGSSVVESSSPCGGVDGEPMKTDDDNNTTAEVLPPSPPPPSEEESITYPITVMFNKTPIKLDISPNLTVLQLKEKVKAQTGVDPNLQKVLLKGVAKDESKLGDLGVGPSTKKILVIGSSIEDVLKVKEIPDEKAVSGSSGSTSSDSGSNWCSLQQHKKVVDKGLPDDVMPGILNEHDPLPPFPLHGMYSSKGSKIRLTFKLESDELWIGTKDRTEKVPIGTIRNVLSQPITGYEHYHILAIQLGPTEASRLFIFWCPAQYIEAIKDALTGA